MGVEKKFELRLTPGIPELFPLQSVRWYLRVKLSAGQRVLSGFCCELGSDLCGGLSSELDSALCSDLNYLPTQGAPVPYVYPVGGESDTDQ